MLTTISDVSQIEDAVTSRLRNRLAGAIGMVAIQKGIEGYSTPGIYVSAEDGRFEREGQTAWLQKITLYIDIIFEHLSDEGQRRQGMHKIVLALLLCLINKNMGLNIKPLVPVSWKNTTSHDLTEKGCMSFSLEMITAYTLKAVDDETVTDLLTVGLSYYLTPGDLIPAAADTQTLQGAQS